MGRPANLTVNILGNAQDVLGAFTQAEGAMSKLGKTASAIGTGIAVLWTGAVAAGAGLLASAVKTGVAYNTLNQTSTAAFKTILGSGEAAAQMMDQISAFAKTSPFPREAFIRATQQMLGFGIAAEKTIPILSAVQNAVAATGGSAADIEDIVSVLAKVQSTGKITATTLNELGARGIDAATLIGEQMGMTGAQIRDAITKGSLDAGEAIDALTVGMETKFAGAAAGVKETWVGATDRIKGAMRDIGSAIVEPFISSTGGGAAVEWANKLADALRAVERFAAPMMTAITGAFSTQLGGIGSILDGITAKLNSFDISTVVSKLGAAAPALGALTGGFAAIAGGLGANLPIIGGLLSGLSGPVGIAIAAFAGLIAVSPQLQTALGGALQQAFQALAPLGEVLASAVGQIADVMTQVVQAATPLIPVIAGLVTQLVSGLAPIIGQLAQSLLPVAQSAFAAIGQVLPTLSDALGALLAAVGPVLPVIADLAATLLGSLLPVIADLASGLLPVLGQAFTALAPLVLELATTVGGALTEVLTTLAPLLSEIGAALIPVVSAAVSALSPIVATLMGALQQLLPPISQLISALLPPLAAFITNVLSAITPLLGPVGNLISQLISLAVRAVTPLLGPLVSLFGAITPILGPVGQLIGLAGNLLGALMNLLTPVINLASSIGGGLVGAISSLIGGGISALAGIFSGISGAINGVVSAISSVIGWFQRLASVASDVMGKVGGWIGGLFSAPIPDYPGPYGLAPFHSRSAMGQITAMAQNLPDIVLQPATTVHRYEITINTVVTDPDRDARVIVGLIRDYEQRRGGVRL